MNELEEGSGSVLDHAVAQGDNEILSLLYRVISASQSFAKPQAQDKQQHDAQSRVDHTSDLVSPLPCFL